MEQELRNKVKEAAKEYYKEVYGKKRVFDYIPPSGKLLGEEELLNMIDASLDMWLTAGRFNKEFETKFAKYLGVKYALSTNSGSSANLLAFSALTSHKLGDRALKKGDEVISVAAGFPTTINPIIQHGMVPVFVDCEIGTYNIDVSKIEQALTDKTKAIFIAHTLGNMFEIDKIKDIANRHGLWVIEDSCDALGAEFNGQKAGTIGDIGTSSFYPPHHMTMGEGGAVYTNNPLLHRLIKSFRDWGRDCWCESGVDDTCHQRFTKQYGQLPLGYDHKYVYSHFGYNLKVTDMQAAIGVAQLEKLPIIVEARRKNWEYLYNGLKDLQDKLILPKPEKNSKPSWFGFLISIKEDSGKSRVELAKWLESHKIQTRNLFAGNLLKHPAFDEMRETGEGYRVVGDLKVTDFIMNNTLWIGVYPGMTQEMLDFMIAKIREYILG